MQTRPYTCGCVALAALLLAGCFSDTPSDSLIKNHLKASNPLVVYGCVNITDYTRLNGFNQGNSYVVKYSIVETLTTSQEDCGAKMSQPAQQDPFKALEAIGHMWNNMGAFVEFSMNGGRRTVKGEITFLKSENGWVPAND